VVNSQPLRLLFLGDIKARLPKPVNAATSLCLPKEPKAAAAKLGT